MYRIKLNLFSVCLAKVNVARTEDEDKPFVGDGDEIYK